MDTFKQSVNDSLESFQNDYRAKLTEEERKALKSTKGVDEIGVGAIVSNHARIEIAQALQMAQTGSTQVVPENTDIFADTQRVTMTDLEGKDIQKDYKVAACKASNIATGSITDNVVVYKASTSLEMTGETSRTIKTEIVSQEQTIFDIPSEADKEEANKDEGHIVKKSDTRDTVVSATIVPDSVKLARELNELNQNSINLRTTLLKLFLEEYKDCKEADAVAVVRSMNRSYSENTFDRIYTKYFGKLDEGNIEQVIFYNELKSAFLANLQTIGSPSVSNEMIRVGFNMRKMSIAGTPKWTKNAGRVKRNSANFYYVSTNLTTGIINVPTTSKIIKDNLGTINSIVDYSIKLTEKEVRAENGLNHDSIILPKCPIIPAVNVKVNILLGMSEDAFSQITDKFNYEVVRLAEDTCSMARDRRTAQMDQNLSEILGG